MHEYRTILYEVERGRAGTTLNRPEKLNALSLELPEAKFRDGRARVSGPELRDENGRLR